MGRSRDPSTPSPPCPRLGHPLPERSRRSRPARLSCGGSQAQEAREGARRPSSLPLGAELIGRGRGSEERVSRG